MLGRFSHAKGMLACVALVNFTKADEILEPQEPRQLEELTQGGRELYFCDPNFEDCEMGPEWQGYSPEIGFGDYGDIYGEWRDEYYDDLTYIPLDDAIGKWFEGLDFNLDGTIDSNELSQVFLNLDTDGDGFLSKEELLEGQIRITARSELCTNYFFQNYFSERLWDPEYQYFGQPFHADMTLYQEMEWLSENFDNGLSLEFWENQSPRRQLQSEPDLAYLEDWPLYDRFDIDPRDSRIDMREWLNVMLSYSQFYSQYTNEWEPILIAERQACNAEVQQLSFERSRLVEDCSITCALTEGCFFFHFDPNDGECLSVFTSSVDCPEGLSSSSYYDFYQNYNSACGEDCNTAPPVPETPSNLELPEGVNLIRSDAACNSRNFGLGYFSSLEECASACLSHSNCQFFVYDENDGECAQEQTSSVDCPEGITSSPYYNFYQVEREIQPVEEQTSEAATLLESNMECNSGDAQLGYAQNLRECSDMCIVQYDCLFFLFDPNDGECRAEYTQGPTCPEGLEDSQYYDFYQNRQRTREEQAAADQGREEAESEGQLWDEVINQISWNQLYNRQECQSENTQLEFYLQEGVSYCAAHCSQTPGCRFFLFDPNDGECLMEMTTSASCPEGLVESPYYDMYELGSSNGEQDDDQGGYDLLGEYVQCSSDNMPLGYEDSLEDCAQNCRTTSGCNFILYDSNDGECIMESTSSADCPEGLFTSSYYNFYQVFADNTGNSINLIGEWQSCTSDDFPLGFFTSGINECADACRSTPGCRFVSFDPNDGECLQEMTSSASCPEGIFQSNYYYFYEVLSGESQPQDDITLLAEWSQCNSENVALGYFESLDRCAAECLSTDNCQFFIYDSNDGECLQEMTSSPQCPEGLSESIYYNFYQVYRPDIHVPIDVEKDFDYRVIRADAYCNADRSDSSYLTIDQCAEMCYDDKSCNFFHHDANDGECFVTYAQNRSCPEGINDSRYYTFYELLADDREDGSQGGDDQVEGRGSYTTILIEEWLSCGSQNVPLGYETTVDMCAAACDRQPECFFFIYDSNDGECIMESTSSADCPEGSRSSNYYHFYQNVYGATTGPPVQSNFDYQLIAERQACEADSLQIGHAEANSRTGPGQCAQMCFDEPSCNFFHFDPNDGECVQVLTQYEVCTEGILPSEWYDFYALYRNGTPTDPVDGPESREVPDYVEGNDWSAVLTIPGGHCSENPRALGVDLESAEQCAQLCFEVASCEFFLWSEYGQCSQDFVTSENCDPIEGYSNQYQLTRIDRSGEVIGENDEFDIVLLQQNAQCLSREVSLGEHSTLESCAAACWSFFDCSVFIYDSVDGECFHEDTSSKNCPEDVRFSNWFNMYELTSKDGSERDSTAPDRVPEAPLPYVTEMIASYSECTSQNTPLGYDFNFHGCAKLCHEANCEFFLHDPNDGECLMENTYNRSCSPDQLVESQYYMFYWNRPRARRLQAEDCPMEADPWSYDWELVNYDGEISNDYIAVTPARMREDSRLRSEVTNSMDEWGIVALGCGGKFDGPGYGSAVHDSHGPECCGQMLVVRVQTNETAEGPDSPEVEVPSEATLRIDDIYAFLTDNAEDVCFDPRPTDFGNFEPPIEDKNFKLAFTHIWFFFDTNRNGFIEPVDIRTNYFDLRNSSPARQVDRDVFEGKFMKNLMELCFESAILYDGDDSCVYDKNQSIYRANRCNNNEKGDLFALFDDNEDGVLSGSEFSGPLRSGDFDGDFLLSPEEFFGMLRQNQNIICKDFEEKIDEVIDEMAKLNFSTIQEYIRYLN